MPGLALRPASLLVVDPRNRYLVNSTRLPQLLGRVAFARST
jgi:hypothetical protein